uniref:Uncharacterized protein n=1 Tax=Cacopsylla melanoneura TaxID=428564 RepID=A0A8D9F5A9_9HEMI
MFTTFILSPCMIKEFIIMLIHCRELREGKHLIVTDGDKANSLTHVYRLTVVVSRTYCGLNYILEVGTPHAYICLYYNTGTYAVAKSRPWNSAIAARNSSQTIHSHNPSECTSPCEQTRI